MGNDTDWTPEEVMSVLIKSCLKDGLTLEHHDVKYGNDGESYLLLTAYDGGEQWRVRIEPVSIDGVLVEHELSKDCWCEPTVEQVD